jgi:hypothetical protein
VGVLMSNVLDLNFFGLYRQLLDPFRNPAFGPELATLLLALAVLVFFGFLCAALPQAIRLRAALTAIKRGSSGQSEQQKRATFVGNYKAIDDALYANRTTSGAWQEFRKCLMFRGSAAQRMLLASNSPYNFFNPRNLHVQYDFVKSLPNYFVGLGLLGTFIGLIAALTFSTQSLADANNQEQIKQALKELLSTAAAKFYISAAGLVSSLILSFLFKLFLRHLHGLVRQINSALEERVLFLSAQTISERQLSVQQSSLEELKVFNTNIAMKIGDAVRSAIEGSNENITRRLSEIAESFSKLLESSRADAGSAVNEAMKGAFDSTLRQAGDAIGSVASSLQELPAKLSSAAAAIQDAGNAAARQQEKLAETIQGAVERILRDAAGQVSTNLEAGTQNLIAGLKATGSTFGDSAVRISAFLERFEGGSTAYIESLTSLGAQSAKLENDLANISAQMIAASDGVSEATTVVNKSLESVLAGITNFTQTATETSRTVRGSQEAIQKTVEILQQQMSQHIQRFDNVDEKMAGIFNSIISHVELQSKQMSEQFSRMDSALASAVNQFEQLIDDLTEVTRTQAAAE